MKQSDIKVGVEYAVVLGPLERNGSTVVESPRQRVVKATVVGGGLRPNDTIPEDVRHGVFRSSDRALKREQRKTVRIEPITISYMGVTPVEWVEPVQVLCTWEQHVKNVAEYQERQERLRVLCEEQDRERAAEAVRVRDLLTRLGLPTDDAYNVGIEVTEDPFDRIIVQTPYNGARVPVIVGLLERIDRAETALAAIADPEARHSARARQIARDALDASTGVTA